MTELIRVAADLQSFCEVRRWRFCFDWRYIDEQLAPLVALKDEPQILSELSRRRTEFER